MKGTGRGDSESPPHLIDGTDQCAEKRDRGAFTALPVGVSQLAVEEHLKLTALHFGGDPDVLADFPFQAVVGRFITDESNEGQGYHGKPKKAEQQGPTQAPAKHQVQVEGKLPFKGIVFHERGLSLKPLKRERSPLPATGILALHQLLSGTGTLIRPADVGTSGRWGYLPFNIDRLTVKLSAFVIDLAASSQFNLFFPRR
ncbi:MAG: hypothetical protein HGJ93_11015 [Desulfosarcina sp.]|nr:hypothetical protein [Desulfosarcina sp.]MBC2766457.1 hypothetical protein [Desulfosarcina sp.]